MQIELIIKKQGQTTQTKKYFDSIKKAFDFLLCVWDLQTLEQLNNYLLTNNYILTIKTNNNK
jgi:hypothetical protein